MTRAAKAPRKPAAKAAARTTKKAVKKVIKKAPVARKTARDMRLERFIAEYLIDLNGTRAAIAAGFSPDSARSIAHELLQRPDVQVKVQSRQATLVEQLEITQKEVLERLQAIATADPRELTALHRDCCRYCWGKGNLFQRTPRERAEAFEEWQQEEIKKQKKDPPEAPTVFNELGGIGYNPKKDPNTDCPECWGDGQGRAVLKDTRFLSPAARMLYAGVEETQHGMKIRTNSQTEALVNIAKHLGMFTKKVELEVAGNLADKMAQARARAGIR